MFLFFWIGCSNPLEECRVACDLRGEMYGNEPTMDIGFIHKKPPPILSELPLTNIPSPEEGGAMSPMPYEQPNGFP